MPIDKNVTIRYRTVVVDDEAPARQLIAQYLENHPEIEVIAECCNGYDAVHVINRERPDMVFLDIQMPGFDGFQVLEKLTTDPYVIFSTAYEHYAIKAFDVNAIDYLLKPYDEELIDRAIKRVLCQASTSDSRDEHWQALLNSYRSLASSDSTILVGDGDKLVPVHSRDIIRIQAARDYSVIVTNKGNLICSIGIGALEIRLDERRFMRVHRSSIIALEAVEYLEKDHFGRFIARLKNGDQVRVSRSYLASIKKLVV